MIVLARFLGFPAARIGEVLEITAGAARSEAEALEIARQSPHARYGGVLEVREIEPTEG